MKYIMVIPDGLTDFRPHKNSKKTPLESARIPYIDHLLKNGMTGVIHTIPSSMPPGSDVANLSLLGMDPRKAKLGRAALEALAQSIKLNKDQTAFRVNFVTIKKDILTDYTGGEIKTKNAAYLIDLLNKNFNDDSIRFYPGVSYRNLAVINRSHFKVKTEPAHNILDKNIRPFLPKGKDGSYIRGIMEKADRILNNNTDAYRKKNKLKADHIWMWGEGHLKKGTSFYERHKLKGAVISAVDIVRGIACFLKMDVIPVPGITGDFHTNYRNKAKYALKYIDKYDFIYVHVEATDEAGHKGDFNEKKRAIEKIDEQIIGPLLKSKKKFNIIIVPDHPTPIRIKTHINEEVPFVFYSKSREMIPNHLFTHYSEQILKRPPLRFRNGHDFLKKIRSFV
ncbi:MAG: cofactor-independent phosphoglycerate mutase [Spirochaetes bacterium]|nr:cofactor-independent phosphoglycerate mutase [Spirochaetota bacterium]